MRGNDGVYYPGESGDLAGIDKAFFLPSEWDISMVVGKDNVVRELGSVCTHDDTEYTIHSFSELVNGEILVSIGPSMTEYLTETGKRMKVVNINRID